MTTAKIAWPLTSNVIRGKSERNTFGMVRKFGNGSPRPHQGWDLSASIGTPVYAIAGGNIEFVRNQGDYGVQVCLAFSFNGTPYYAFYAHLQRTSVIPGSTVKIGSLIATSGNSGNARNLPRAEDHLHFEIRTTRNPGAGLAGRVSPLKIFGRCPLKAPIVGAPLQRAGA